MQSIIINGRRIAVSIVRSNRKTIQLKITSSTHIEVRAPLLMTDNAIHALLIKKQDWITSHLAKASQSLMATSSALPHVLLFFGREIPLHLNTSALCLDRRNQKCHHLLLSHDGKNLLGRKKCRMGKTHWRHL
ncbi:MAG: DUF45 domain-containing protein [Selenomonadales bacterium]|nr:DUF45 domain-containing protein [Selenomonadales bacterium]